LTFNVQSASAIPVPRWVFCQTSSGHRRPQKERELEKEMFQIQLEKNGDDITRYKWSMARRRRSYRGSRPPI